jgi:hypothetical protein
LFKEHVVYTLYSHFVGVREQVKTIVFRYQG